MTGYEDGFAYGEKCARSMSPSRRADNARMVRESEYFSPSSPTHDYWRGFVSAMETSLVHSPREGN
jgi:hypothetical protein